MARRRRGIARGAFVAAVGLLLPVAGVPLPVAVSDAALAQSVAEAPAGPDEASAQAAARASGRRVEVSSLTTETRQVFANPDGSFTLEQHLQPVRARRGNSWVPVDTRLEKRADGSIAPVASAVEMVFSGGGTAPLARLSRDGKELVLGWPGRLPEPVLEGDTATYPEVLPGVDLRVRAHADGFSEVLVVKTPQAAANPALARLRFTTAGSKGVSVVKDTGGGLKAVDETGQVVFHAPAPRMWDSPGSADGIAVAEVADEPAFGSREAVMAVQTSPGEMAIVPNQQMLADPKTRFPVYIDPSWSGSRQAWTYVSKRFATTSYYKASGDVKVGYYNDPNAYPTSDTYRTFFQMDTSAVKGKHILSATLRIKETHSWSCSPRPVELWATNSISSSTTWNKQPTWAYRMDSKNVAHGYSSSCPDADVEFNATTQVTNSAKNGWNYVTMGLRAANESDTYGWKKFNNNPVLVITYNSIPNAPSNLKIYPNLPCATGSGRPVIGAPGTTKLLATVSDPDGGNVKARFEWWDLNKTTKIGGTLTSAKSSGLQHEALIPSSDIGTGKTFSWRVRAEDGTDVGPWSQWCEVTVDLQAPTKGPTVSSTTYPPDDTGVYGGGVGKPGSFTFGPNGVSDVVSYEYELDGANGTSGTVAASGPNKTATVSLTPKDSEAMLHTLRVRSRDQANGPGPWTYYSFYVNGPSAPIGHWKFGEGSGTTAADSSGNNRNATLGGGVSRTSKGRIGKALVFDGATGYAATAGPVVRTDTSFTVSAWVRLDTLASTNRMAVTQDGGVHSGFFLGYQASSKKWVFRMPIADATGTSLDTVVSQEPAVVGAWTHLVGVYDASDRKIRLYVNGAFAGEAARAVAWNAGGALQIGRSKWNGSYTDWWPGAIDDVRVWDRVVYDKKLGGQPSEIPELANRPPRLEGKWVMEEAGGTTLVDLSGNGRTATLNGAATWTDGHLGDDSAVAFDGSSGYAVTTGPVVRTDSSFTVSAWVRLDRTTGVGSPVAVSQIGTRMDGFGLEYSEPFGGWAFTMKTTDSDGAGSVRAVAPADQFEVIPGQWTHLAGVYDDAAKTMTLYVNGLPAASATFNPQWNANGPLMIGRALYQGNPDDFWPGSVDEVRVYTGALTADEVLALSFDLEPETGPNE